MKPTPLGILCLLFITISPAEAHSPHDAIFSCAISPDYSKDSQIFCSADHLGVYILNSDNAGITWRPAVTGLVLNEFMPSYNDYITALAYSPDYGSDRTLFAGTESGKVFKSTDGGSSWQLSDNGLPGMSVTCLSVSPDFASDRTIAAGTRGLGIFISRDAGQTWLASSVGLTNYMMTSLCFSPAYGQDGTIFAASFWGVYRSTDGGFLWAPSNTGLTNLFVTCLAISPDFANDSEIYLGTFGAGMYHSSDGGASWFGCSSGITDPFMTTIALSPSYTGDRTVFAASADTGVFKSQDGGQAWSLYDSGLDFRTTQANGLHFRGLLISPNYASDFTVYAAMYEGFFKSTNAGMSWKEMDVYSPQMVKALSVSPDYANDGTVFCCTYGGGVYRTLNGGAKWEAANKGLNWKFIYDVCYVSSDQKGVLSLGTAREDKHGRLYRSVSNGDIWNESVIDPINYIKPTVFAPTPDFLRDYTIFLGSRADTLFPFYKSGNGGGTFKNSNPGFDGVYSIAVSPHFTSDNTLYVGIGGRYIKGVHKSIDGGMTWTSSGLAASFVTSMDISEDNVIIAGTLGNGIFASVDGGVSWTEVNNGLSDLTIASICLSPNYINDRIAFAASTGGGVFKSTDGGRSWSPSGLKGVFINELKASPSFATDQTIFAGTWDGIYKSTDAASTWDLVSYLVRYEEDADIISTSGTWSNYKNTAFSCSQIFYSMDPGSSMTFPFYGRSVNWLGIKGPDQGIAVIRLDGNIVATVDLYSPQYESSQSLHSFSFSTVGYHQLNIIVTAAHNPCSTDTMVNFDAFDVVYN